MNPPSTQCSAGYQNRPIITGILSIYRQGRGQQLAKLPRSGTRYLAVKLEQIQEGGDEVMSEGVCLFLQEILILPH